jgi:SagB-type dehydrogenase family enzyme
MTLSDQENILKKIIRYHEETKHHYHRYAKSSGYMDWENQPNPFRFYEETSIVELPLLKEDPPTTYPDMYQRKNNSPRRFTVETIAGFLELSLGLSAWKAVQGSQWALRMNPSSGNLHPTEAYLVLPQTVGVGGGVYHYNSLIHALEQRATVRREIWQTLFTHFGCEGFLIGLSSIFWRESWKYGERAFRYCNHDVGHALAAVSFSANLFGWKATYLNGLSDETVSTVLGFHKTRFARLEEEHPDLLCFVHPHPHLQIPRTLPDVVETAFTNLAFRGKPNILSKECINWDIIYQTANLARKPRTEAQRCRFDRRDWRREVPSQLSAAGVIRQRRSATSFDRNASVSKDQFLAILDQTLPRVDSAPFDAEFMDPSIHLLIFVHQVEGLKPGLYFFLRNEKDAIPIRDITRSGFLWQPIEENFPLFLLEKGNFRQQAAKVSCHQDIAGSGVFSLGMIAAFSDVLADKLYGYRQLFWESGMIGQVLYLAAEACGVRGTGIGCFFDDAVHEILGLEDNRYQSLYHFTIGRPVEDPRLTTYPAYHHLKNR